MNLEVSPIRTISAVNATTQNPIYNLSFIRNLHPKSYLKPKLHKNAKPKL